MVVIYKRDRFEIHALHSVQLLFAINWSDNRHKKIGAVEKKCWPAHSTVARDRERASEPMSTNIGEKNRRWKITSTRYYAYTLYDGFAVQSSSFKHKIGNAIQRHVSFTAKKVTLYTSQYFFSHRTIFNFGEIAFDYRHNVLANTSEWESVRLICVACWW